MTDARTAAVRVLTALERGQTTLTDELERIRGDVASRREKGLLFEIAAGTLRWQAALDTMIGALSRRPVARLDPVVRAVLRIGAYQLTHLDRVPAHAVVHESVEAVRRLRFRSATGFVNAVLRGIARGDGQAALPPRPTTTDDRAGWSRYLSTALSHPAWLVERWMERYGPDATERWCQFNNAAPSVTLRLDDPADRSALIARLADIGIAARPGAHVAAAVLIPPGGASRLPVDALERSVIHDEGSQLVALAAAGTEGQHVLDVCAAPGGKTVILVTEGGRRRFVVAADYRPTRIALLRTTVQRADLEVPIVRLDASRPLPFAATFDTVLLDAPCSGLGTLRRDPDLKWSRQPADVARLADVEVEMLRHAATTVRPGGAVVYSTCSSEPDENEAVVDRFLRDEPAFTLTPIKFPPSVSGGDALLDDHGRLRTLPFRDGMDAYFAAVLRRAR